MCDNEIVYLLQNEYDKQLESQLWSKHYSGARNVARRILHKFYSVGLENCDLEHIIYRAFQRTIQKFDKELKIKFIQFFITTLKGLTQDYIKKFLSNRHKVLNKGSNIEKVSFLLGASFSLEKTVTNKTIVDQIFNLKTLSKEEVSVLRMKFEGLTIREIMNATNKDKNEIEKFLYYLYKKIRTKIKFTH